MFTLMANNVNAANSVLATNSPANLELAIDQLYAMPRFNLALAVNPPNALAVQHLIYAYMIENTRIVEIFKRVLNEYAHGERLPFPTLATRTWAIATEKVFFTSPRPGSVWSLASEVRPDNAAIRRNAYQRMFGMDLNHGTDGTPTYPYVRAEVANRQFVNTFERLLEEVWRGYINRINLIGPNTTDDQAIRELVRELREMMTARRNGPLGPQLYREEFYAVAMMSWFDLTVAYDTAIVVDLNAQSSSPALRLQKISERVGVPMSANADSYFQMSTAASVLLNAIEAGIIEPNVAQLYTGGVYTQAVQVLVTHWSIATKRNIKGDSLRPLAPGATLPALGAPATLRTFGRSIPASTKTPALS